MCCIHDLQPIRSPDIVSEVEEHIEEDGARCWDTLDEALQELQAEHPFDDFERGIAFGLRRATEQ